MNIATIEQIIHELSDALIGRRPGKIFPLSRFSMAIDFRLSDSRYLFISIEPADPRTYLIRRRLRDIEKRSVNPTPFVMLLKKRFSGAEVDSLAQVQGERVVKIGLSGIDEIGSRFTAGLIIQLTGKSANLFLTNNDDRIVDSLREKLGDGQQIGDI